MGPQHIWWRVLLMAFTFLALGAFFFYYLMTIGLVNVNNLLYESLQNTTNSYSLMVKPALWINTVWVIVFIFEFAFVSYSISTIFRRSCHGFLYYAPPYLPHYIHILYAINIGVNIAWQFAWNHKIIILSLALRLVSAIVLILILHVSIRALLMTAPGLSEQGFRADILFVRGFQNGWSLWCTWSWFMGFVDVGYTLSSYSALSPMNASFVTVALILAAAIAHFVTDTWFAPTLMRYLIAPYIVLIYMLVAMLIGSINEHMHSEPFHFVMAVLAITSLMLIIKFVRLFRFCHCAAPSMPMQPPSIYLPEPGSMCSQKTVQSYYESSNSQNCLCQTPSDVNCLPQPTACDNCTPLSLGCSCNHINQGWN